ncbi:MAG: tetratricopeptide repeat protein [Phycisphaerales bacterium]
MNIKRFIKNTKIKTNPAVNDAVLNGLLETFDKSKAARPNTWRIIMKSRITKLAVAAVLLIAAVLTITFLDKSVAPAYAIEQTVEAMKNVRFLHLVSYNETGEIKDERWIELGFDGHQVKYRQDTPPDFLVIEDGKTTAVYYKNKRTVVLHNKENCQYQWIGPLGAFLENLRQKGKIIKENVEYNGQKVHLISWPMMNVDCYIDPATNLPLTVGAYHLSYEQPDDSIFTIFTPKDYNVVNAASSDTTNVPNWLKEQKQIFDNFELAKDALIMGNYSKASALFESVVQIEVRHNWAWFWLGTSYYELGKYDLAIKNFTKAIDLVDGVYAYYARGLAYASMGDKEMAQKDFNKALPWMIQSLREPSAASMFEYADNPRYSNGNETPPQESQIVSRMINRLKLISGQNFNYDPNLSLEENETVISAWENWFKTTQNK